MRWNTLMFSLERRIPHPINIGPSNSPLVIDPGGHSPLPCFTVGDSEASEEPDLADVGSCQRRTVIEA